MMSKIQQFILSLFCVLFLSIASGQMAIEGHPLSIQQQITSFTSDTSKKIKSLSIGDHVPDIEFRMLNSPTSVSRLSDFKGKLVLLDFWATWCWSCIASFPKLTSLEKEFNNKLKIILVNSITTGDSKEKILQLFQKEQSTNEGKFNLSIAFEDSISQGLFPHFELPHYVWVSPSGIVSAITSSHELTIENIQRALNEGHIELPEKIDFIPDKLMGLDLRNNSPIEEDILHYSIFKKGKLEGIKTLNEIRYEKKEGSTIYINRGLALYNVPLLDIYEKGIEDKKEFIPYSRKRIVLNVKDRSKLVFDDSVQDRIAWEKENLYSYDLVVPSTEMANLRKYIFNDLNEYSNYSAKIEKRSVPCCFLVVINKNARKRISTSNIQYEKSGDIYSIKNSSLVLLADFLNKDQKFKFPVFSQGKPDIVIDIELNSKNLSLAEINNQLIPQGVKLLIRDQVIDMLIVSDKDQSK